MTDIAPRRISDREVPLVLTGYFMPTHAPNVPVLIGMPGTDDLFVFVFSTEAKLASAMASIGMAYERVALVTDGRELLDEIKATNERGERPYRLRVAVDPYKTDNGRVRFVEPLAPADLGEMELPWKAVAEATLIDLKPGQIIAVSGKLYGRCADCRGLVRVDKWLFGSLHYCAPVKGGP